MLYAIVSGFMEDIRVSFGVSTYIHLLCVCPHVPAGIDVSIHSNSHAKYHGSGTEKMDARE